MKPRNFYIGPTLMDNESGVPVVEVKFFGLSTPQASSFLERVEDAGKDARAYAIVRDLADLLKITPPGEELDALQIEYLALSASELVEDPTLEYDYVSFAHFVWLVQRLLAEPQSSLYYTQVEAVIKEFEATYGKK